MKILIGQPKHEKGLSKLENILRETSNIDIVLFPEGYLYSVKLIHTLKEISKKNNIIIITSYKDEKNKDRIIITGKKGEVLLERPKTPVSNEILEKNILLEPSKIETEHGTIGIVLCMEIFFNSEDLKDIDYLFNPIGVGMFSDEQYTAWTDRARELAVRNKAIVIGASHSDGFYRDYKVSIPLSYVIDGSGNAKLMTKNDTRYRIIDTESYECEIIEIYG